MYNLLNKYWTDENKIHIVYNLYFRWMSYSIGFWTHAKNKFKKITISQGSWQSQYRLFRSREYDLVSMITWVGSCRFSWLLFHLECSGKKWKIYIHSFQSGVVLSDVFRYENKRVIPESDFLKLSRFSNLYTWKTICERFVHVQNSTEVKNPITNY